MPWYSKPYEEILTEFEVSAENGLTSSQVIKQRELHGENVFISQKPKSQILLLLEQFNNPIIYILIVAGILNALIADIKDALFICFVVILNTTIGFIQERRASNELKTLNKLAAPNARVIRDATQILIPTTEVVCGDIIVLESGMRSPADVRLIDSNNLLVDESMLTGESFSANKEHDTIVDKSTPLGDRFNMVFSGTIIQRGRGLGVVTEVGLKTEFGKISQNVAEAEETVSPLQVQIEKFSKGLSVAILSTVIAIFIVGFLRGNDIITMFLTSVGLAVSAIPEGLPVAVTITLSIGVSQMAKYKAVVKRLSAVETLGSTNVICTDKTGTLTKNQMTVTKLYCGGEEFNVTGSGYQIDGKVLSHITGKSVHGVQKPALELAAFVGTLCSESTIVEAGKDWKITGDPTEGALMILAKKLGITSLDAKVYVDVPFESDNQLMAVRTEIGNKGYIFVKGAPEKIIARCCNSINRDGKVQQLIPEEINLEISNFSNDGLRILALAFTEYDGSSPITLKELSTLSFIGFAGIEDTIRPEAVQAVKECHSAGIRVVMITGDHVKTAQSIAKQVGIAPTKDIPTAISGRELDEMSDADLFRRVPDIDVYARVAPQHKFRIVKQLQAQNNVVSMTGDGVNDAPALKQADIGVAMGSGSDVAREAAHMVLMDDNFATIVQAVRRGRIILHNLQHILLYILSTSFGGLFTIAMSVAIGFPLPMLAAQLLWVNLVTDGTSTFPLAFEKEHGDVMAFPPRKRDRPLISKKMIVRIIIAGFFMMIGTLLVFKFCVHNINNLTKDELTYARTMAFCVLAFFQIWNVQNSRSLDRSIFLHLPFYKMHRLDRISPMKNLPLLGVMILAVLLQVAAVQVPFMNDIMDTVKLDLRSWLVVFSVTFSIIIIIEIIKYFQALVNKDKREKGIKEIFQL